jgi:hypothetical protein
VAAADHVRVPCDNAFECADFSFETSQATAVSLANASVEFAAGASDELGLGMGAPIRNAGHGEVDSFARFSNGTWAITQEAVTLTSHFAAETANHGHGALCSVHSPVCTGNPPLP